MLGRLFKVAVNTLGLRYCENDGRRLSDCLGGHYAYQIVAPIVSYGAILESFAHFLDSCSKTDTAILYFSGHGKPNGGRLFFPLRDDQSKRANRIDLNQLLLDFQGCAAQNKLVILDCCYAAEAAKIDWPTLQSDKYLILAASRATETAKEVLDLEGGLMTTKFVEILACPPDSIISADGKLHIQSIFSELHARIKRYKDDHPTNTISLPNLIGNAGSDFPLGSPPMSHETTLLSAVAAHSGANLTKLIGLCAELTTTDFNDALDRLQRAKCLTVMHNIAVMLDAGWQRLQRTTQHSASKRTGNH